MNSRRRFPLPLSFSPWLLSANLPGSKSARMCGAAGAFSDSLSDAQRAQATFEFTDEERLNWYYIPRERRACHCGLRGAPLKNALALETGLSGSRLRQEAPTMSLEESALPAGRRKAEGTP